MERSEVRWLVRFGYDGRTFAGWARQPGLRTVEGSIREGVVRVGVARDADSAAIRVASRTDRGVSARGNALTVRSVLPPSAMLRALNGIEPDIWFLGAARVPEDFRERSAVLRTYRYFDPRPVRNPARRRAATRLFAGSIDVRSFGRALPSRTPIFRLIEGVGSRGTRGGAEIEIRAPSFVWGMVRKIVGALRQVDEGRLSIPELRAAVEGRSRLSLPMAEAAPLVLWEVQYKVPWGVEWIGPNRHQRRYLDDQRFAARARSDLLRAFPS